MVCGHDKNEQENRDALSTYNMYTYTYVVCIVYAQCRPKSNSFRGLLASQYALLYSYTMEEASLFGKRLARIEGREREKSDASSQRLYEYIHLVWPTYSSIGSKFQCLNQECRLKPPGSVRSAVL